MTLGFSWQTYDKVNDHDLSSAIDGNALELRDLSGDVLQTLLKSTVHEPLGVTIMQQGVSHFIGMKIHRIMGTSRLEFRILPLECVLQRCYGNPRPQHYAAKHLNRLSMQK